MFKKLLVVTAAMAVSASAFADINISGLYEGTLDSHGAYTQDITTTMVGTSGNSTVTMILDKDFTVDDLYVTTTSGPLTFTLGDKSGDDPDQIVLGVTMQAGGLKLGLNQVSGGATSADVSGVIGGVSLAMTDVTSSTRETTASYTLGGLKTVVVYNKVAAGSNIDTTLSTTIAGLTLSANHDRDSDGTSASEGSVSKDLVGLGVVKLTMGTDNTKEVSLTRGIWTAEWAQTGSTAGVASLKASLKF
jgi:hypothetical protein